MRFIDSHTHIYLRGIQDVEAMSAAGVEGVVICSYFPVKPTGPATLIDLHRWLTDDEPKRLRSCGVKAAIAVGIHPRCIPPIGVADVLQDISTIFESGKASALGEVGLETASSEEVEILIKQMAIADRYNVPMIFHTPRQNKNYVFDKLLKLLQDQKIDVDKVIIDHLTVELVPKAREIGANAGITVQPGKMTEKDVVSIVSSYGTEGILVNSDLSNVISDPLAVPKVAREMIEAGINKADAERVTYLNAKNIFKF